MGVYNFELKQGQTFKKTFTFVDDDGAVVDLSNKTAFMRIKESKSDTDALLEASTVNGRITIAINVLTIEITAAALATSNVSFDVAWWDLELREGSTVDRVLEGMVTMSKEVTRESEDDDMTDWVCLGPFRISGNPIDNVDYWEIPIPYDITISKFIATSYAAPLGTEVIRAGNAAAGAGDYVDLEFAAGVAIITDETSELVINGNTESDKLYIRVVTGGNLTDVDVTLWGKV